MANSIGVFSAGLLHNYNLNIFVHHSSPFRFGYARTLITKKSHYEQQHRFPFLFSRNITDAFKVLLSEKHLYQT